MGDVLASEDDDGRGRLRKVRGSCQTNVDPELIKTDRCAPEPYCKLEDHNSDCKSIPQLQKAAKNHRTRPCLGRILLICQDTDQDRDF
jgi:hypothetical protein